MPIYAFVLSTNQYCNVESVLYSTVSVEQVCRRCTVLNTVLNVEGVVYSRQGVVTGCCGVGGIGKSNQFPPTEQVPTHTEQVPST